MSEEHVTRLVAMVMHEFSERGIPRHDIGDLLRAFVRALETSDPLALQFQADLEAIKGRK